MTNNVKDTAGNKLVVSTVLPVEENLAMDKGEESNDVIPVTSLDDELQTTQTIPQEEYGSPNNQTSGLIQVSHGNDAYSSGLQLESSLNESVNDSYAQADGLMKVPQLESTRLSLTCTPGDFDPEGDLSKVQSEPGDLHNPLDSQNPLNAGFFKSNNENQSSSKLATSENCIFTESNSVEGVYKFVAICCHLSLSYL